MERIELSTEDAKTNRVICSRCNLAIKDQYIYKAVDRLWHELCLTCSTCGEKLISFGDTFYMKFGRIFCKNDYLRLFGPSSICISCHLQIYGNDVVIRKDHENIYHEYCFRCFNCQRSFTVGERCVTDKLTGKVFCLDNGCHKSKEKKSKKTKKYSTELAAS